VWFGKFEFRGHSSSNRKFALCWPVCRRDRHGSGLSLRSRFQSPSFPVLWRAFFSFFSTLLVRTVVNAKNCFLVKIMSFLLVANIGRRNFGWFSRECLSSEEVHLCSVAVVWCFFCGEFVLLCGLPAMSFFPPPLSLPFLLFPFLPHLYVRCKCFSVLPPTRAIQGHLGCLVADAGRTRVRGGS
jgi:hypothetical protein